MAWIRKADQDIRAGCTWLLIPADVLGEFWATDRQALGSALWVGQYGTLYKRVPVSVEM